jgi:hypothetical protein
VAFGKQCWAANVKKNEIGALPERGMNIRTISLKRKFGGKMRASAI